MRNSRNARISRRIVPSAAGRPSRKGRSAGKTPRGTAPRASRYTQWVSLQQYLGRSVDAHIRARGRDYFRMGAVAIERGDAWAVRAHVRGTDSYQVDLLRDSRDEIAAWCTCPYAGRAELCKHIWAVVLAADASALLQGNGSSAQVIIGLAAKRIEQALDERDAPGSLDDDDDVDSTVDSAAAGTSRPTSHFRILAIWHMQRPTRSGGDSGPSSFGKSTRWVMPTPSALPHNCIC